VSTIRPSGREAGRTFEVSSAHIDAGKKLELEAYLWGRLSEKERTIGGRQTESGHRSLAAELPSTGRKLKEKDLLEKKRVAALSPRRGGGGTTLNMHTTTWRKMIF